MIINFRCAVWLHAFEQPTACDLTLQIFGREESNVVSYKMLIKLMVLTIINYEVSIGNLNIFPDSTTNYLLHVEHMAKTANKPNAFHCWTDSDLCSLLQP